MLAPTPVGIADTAVQSLRVCFMWDEAHSQQYSPSDLKRWMAKHSYSNKVAPEDGDTAPPPKPAGKLTDPDPQNDA